MRLSFAMLLGFCLTLLIPSAAASQSSGYVYREITIPGATRTTANGINDRSQIVGTFVGTDGGSHGFLWSQGEVTVIDCDNGVAGVPKGINNLGQVVGYCPIFPDPRTGSRGFRWERGELTLFGPPGFSVAEDINDAGQIAGEYGSFDGPVSFLWTHGRFVDTSLPVENPPIGPFGHTSTGINESGQVLESDPRRGTAFRVDPGGASQEIQVPGARWTTVTGVNDRSEIVGWWISRDNTDPGRTGFLLAFGHITSFDVPGETETVPEDINNRGQIVGNTARGAFLATPVGIPEDVSGDPSASGTRIPVATFVVDGTLATWTLGPAQEILRDGVQVTNAYGSQILWYESAIYVLGDDYRWWKWSGATWDLFGPNDPSR